MQQDNEDDEINYVDDSYDEMYGEEDQIASDFGNDINEEDLDVVEVDYSKAKKGKRKVNDNQLKNKKESPPKKKKKINPIVYTKSRSNSPENKPSLASAITSVTRKILNLLFIVFIFSKILIYSCLGIEKRAPMSSVITTVDKSSELCRYWPACTLGINCAYHHPEVPCR